MSCYLDDQSLERLNALALSHDRSAPHTLSTEVLLMIQDQTRKGISRLGDAFIVTDRTLVDQPAAALTKLARTGNIVDRVSALARLLDLEGAADWLPWASRLTEWQRELSQLLVRYPVLMDHRFAVAGFSSVETQPRKFELAPLPHLLAHTMRASLPRLAHGVTENELRRFAACPSVRSGLTRSSFRLRLPDSRLSSRTVTDLVFPELPAKTRGVPLRGQFVVSMMEISELARQETGQAILLGEGEGSRLEVRERVAMYTARLFWDVAVNAGAQCDLAREDLVRAVTLPSGNSHWVTLGEILPYYIGLQLDRAFEVGEPGSTEAVQIKAEGVRHAIGMLVDAGVQADGSQAARWIAGQLIGQARLSDGPCAQWQSNEILAVLEELEAHGGRPDMPPTSATPAGTWREPESLERWAQAIDMHARRADMRARIASRVAAGTAPAASIGPRRRLRAV